MTDLTATIARVRELADEPSPVEFESVWLRLNEYVHLAPQLAAECERLRVELEMIRDAAADAIRDNEHVGFTVRTLHVLRTIKL